jgi:hypothetical protein
MKILKIASCNAQKHARIFDENENLFYSENIFTEILLCQKLICENSVKCNSFRVVILKIKKTLLMNPLLDLRIILGLLICEYQLSKPLLSRMM